MAVGASDGYWIKEKLPSVFKHELLRCYLPKFTAKLGHTYGSVTLLDGYAGRGEYESGAPGSGRQMLDVATNISRPGVDVTVFLVERDRKSAAALELVAAGADASPNVHVRVRGSTVQDTLDEVVEGSVGQPLFLFLDPCGLLIPFDTLVATLKDHRHSSELPTELLLNFSSEAVRRIGGHVMSTKGDPKGIARLDAAVGGDWWQEPFRQGMTGEAAVDFVVTGYMRRLGKELGIGCASVPVHRRRGQQSVYHLIFATRSSVGLWHFGDSVARAQEKWREASDARDRAATNTMVIPGLDEHLGLTENRAVPDIAENIARSLNERGTFVLRNRVLDVYGDYFGQVRETVVRAAVKSLYDEGRTSCNGKRDKVENLRITPPA